MFPRVAENIFSSSSSMQAIQFKEIPGFAFYLTAVLTRTSMGLVPKKEREASKAKIKDMHYGLLGVYRMESKKAGGIPRSSDVIFGAPNNQGNRSKLASFAAPFYLLLFSIKLVTEFPVRIMDIFLEKCTDTLSAIVVERRQKQNRSYRDIAVMAAAGVACVPFGIAAVGMKIVSLIVRSVLSHQEVWTDAAKIDQRFFENKSIFAIGPVEAVSRLVTVTALSVMCFSMLPLALTIGAALSIPVIAPAIAPTAAPIMKGLGTVSHFFASNLGVPITLASKMLTGAMVNVVTPTLVKIKNIFFSVKKDNTKKNAEVNSHSEHANDSNHTESVSSNAQSYNSMGSGANYESYISNDNSNNHNNNALLSAVNDENAQLKNKDKVTNYNKNTNSFFYKNSQSSNALDVDCTNHTKPGQK